MSIHSYWLNCGFQIAQLEQQVVESSERLSSAQQQIAEKQQNMEKLVSATPSTVWAFRKEPDIIYWRLQCALSKSDRVCAQEGERSAEKAFLDQQLSLLEQQSQEKMSRLEDCVASLQKDKQTLQNRLVCFLRVICFYSVW